MSRLKTNFSIHLLVTLHTNHWTLTTTFLIYNDFQFWCLKSLPPFCFDCLQCNLAKGSLFIFLCQIKFAHRKHGRGMFCREHMTRAHTFRTCPAQPQHTQKAWQGRVLQNTWAHTFNREHAQSNLSMLTEPSSACENANNSLKKHLTVNLHIFGQEQKHFALFFTYLEQAFHASWTKFCCYHGFSLML